MTAWAAGAWATGAWQGTAWQSAAPVTVPDVTGLTQAAATALLEADGFVVVVETAASSAVAAGIVISQVPAGGSSSTSGATVTITVSTGEEDILSAKFLGYPNVRRRGLQREEEPPSEPLPAEITNMPGAAPPPKPELLARGVVESAIDHAAPEPVPEIPTPEIPVPTVKVAPKLTLVAPAPAPTPEPESPAPEPLTVAQQVEAAVEEAMSALRAKTIKELAKAVEGTLNALGERIGELTDQVELLQKSLTETQRIAALEKRNRARAEAIARELLNDGEKDA